MIGKYRYEFRTDLTLDLVLQGLAKDLPEFLWRRGDSEHLGFYANGELHQAGKSVRIVVVLEDEPAYITVEHPDEWANNAEEQERIDGYCQRVLQAVQAKDAAKQKILPGRA